MQMKVYIVTIFEKINGCTSMWSHFLAIQCRYSVSFESNCVLKHYEYIIIQTTKSWDFTLQCTPQSSHTFRCARTFKMVAWAWGLYFVSPRERLWRQRVFRRQTLVIARATWVFSHAFKKEHRDWRIKDASCSVYSWMRSVTSRSYSGWDKVYTLNFLKCTTW